MIYAKPDMFAQTGSRVDFLRHPRVHATLRILIISSEIHNLLRAPLLLPVLLTKTRETKTTTDFWTSLLLLIFPLQLLAPPSLFEVARANEAVAVRSGRSCGTATRSYRDETIVPLRAKRTLSTNGTNTSVRMSIDDTNGLPSVLRSSSPSPSVFH